MVVLQIIFVVLAAAGGWWFGKRATRKMVLRFAAKEALYEHDLKSLQDAQVLITKEKETIERELAKVVHQKKSSEVRTGQIAEQMAPFLNEFPYPPSTCCFLGKPIDFVSFTNDGVHFIEVKSGNSQLSSKQRLIRDLIKEGNVSFEIYRVKGE